jgi:hypothetical protein
MSDILVSNASTSELPIEGRHIYHQNNLKLNRKDFVELIPPSHLEDEDYFEEEEGTVLQKKNLRVDPNVRNDGNVRQKNYDPWKDIYLRGNFDRQRSAGYRKKTDRKSLDYVEYEEADEKFDDEYEYEEDEDLPSYNRRPYSSNKVHRRKRPTKIRRNQTKSGMGYYDYEDPSKYESPPQKELMMMKPPGCHFSLYSITSVVVLLFKTLKTNKQF